MEGNSPHLQKIQKYSMTLGTPEDSDPEVVETKVKKTLDGAHAVPPIIAKVEDALKENGISNPEKVAKVQLKNESSSEEKCMICGMRVRNMKVHIKLNHKKPKGFTGSHPPQLSTAKGSKKSRSSMSII